MKVTTEAVLAVDEPEPTEGTHEAPPRHEGDRERLSEADTKKAPPVIPRAPLPRYAPSSKVFRCG